MSLSDNFSNPDYQKVYLLELKLGHRVDGDTWTYGGTEYFYITDYNTTRVYKKNCSDLSAVSDILTSDLAYGICSDGTHFYLLDGTNSLIEKYLCSDMSLVSSFGSNGSGDNQFDIPFDICTDGTYLYIADSGNDRIKKHKCSDLSYVAKIGSNGSGDDQFDKPRGICTDGTHVYIGDTLNNRIKKHKCSDLSYVSKIGSSGSGDDQFSSPLGIDTDKTNLYIADSANHRIVKRLCSDLSYVSEVGGVGSGDDTFGNVYDVAVDDNGVYFYLIDYGNHRVLKRLCSDLSYVSEANVTTRTFYLGYSCEAGCNTYYISHTDGTPVAVEEDGTALTEKSSLSDCSDNSSSWYWDSTNERLYLHTSGSDDPGGGSYTIVVYFWEYLSNGQYDADVGIEYDGNIYLPYLNDDDIPDIQIQTSEYHEGGIRQSFGSIRIINADSRYDTRLSDYIYENREVRLLAGAKGDSYTDFGVFWSGWTGKVEWTEEDITLHIEDIRRITL